MGFELKLGLNFWLPSVPPSLPGTQVLVSGVAGETTQDPNVQWTNRYSASGRRYTYTFRVTTAELLSFETFFLLAAGSIFQFREGTVGDDCAEITSYRNVSFPDDGLDITRQRVGKDSYYITFSLQEAV